MSNSPEDKQKVLLYSNTTGRYMVGTYYKVDQWERTDMFVISEGAYLDTTFIHYWMELPASPDHYNKH